MWQRHFRAKLFLHAAKLMVRKARSAATPKIGFWGFVRRTDLTPFSISCSPVTSPKAVWKSRQHCVRPKATPSKP